MSLHDELFLTCMVGAVVIAIFSASFALTGIAHTLKDIRDILKSKEK